ncbi:MAG: TraR/DksA C4-type zinc finger protein [Paracoccus sp. (in: a-proteobacteria)]
MANANANANANLDLAERFAQIERDAGARRISAAVSAPGSRYCCDCGEAIEEARRKAAPFAVRCITCQQSHERGV